MPRELLILVVLCAGVFPATATSAEVPVSCSTDANKDECAARIPDAHTDGMESDSSGLFQLHSHRKHRGQKDTEVAIGDAEVSRLPLAIPTIGHKSLGESWESWCTEPAPEWILTVTPEEITSYATSHDADKQRGCYGHAAGDKAEPSAKGNILGNLAEVRNISCDMAGALQFRREFNIVPDEKAQLSKKILFQNVVSAFHMMGAPVMLSHGLLLGWWRECDFLADDQDLDVGVFHRSLPVDFVQQLEDLGFTVSIRVPEEARFQNIHDNIGLEVTLSNASDHSSAPKPYCDFFVYEEDGVYPNAKGTLEYHAYHSLWHNGAVKRFWSCPTRFESLAVTRWNDVDVWVPYPPETELKIKYGLAWDKPMGSGGSWGVYHECDQAHPVSRSPWQRGWELLDEEKFMATQASMAKKVGGSG